MAFLCGLCRGERLGISSGFPCAVLAATIPPETSKFRSPPKVWNHKIQLKSKDFNGFPLWTLSGGPLGNFFGRPLRRLGRDHSPRDFKIWLPIHNLELQNPIKIKGFQWFSFVDFVGGSVWEFLRASPAPSWPRPSPQRLQNLAPHQKFGITKSN